MNPTQTPDSPIMLSILAATQSCLRLLPALVFLFTFQAPAQDQSFSQPEIEFFERHIRPMLVENCHQCHSRSADKLKAGLLLDSRDGFLKGGDSGPAIIPGQPDKSLLMQAVSYENVDLQMPPKAKLPARAMQLLEQWIRTGAAWPAEQLAPATTAEADPFDLDSRRAAHWAWQPISSFPLPEIENRSWPKTEVDHFILAKLETEQLMPAPRADQRTRLRRLYLDLTGLPPTPDEIAAFLANPAPDAWEQTVDQLLDSPRFGEKWARHWLDQVRYAETMGHEFDYAIEGAWRYRDYVIRAFNEDLPFNQFVIEQVAGDLLPSPRRNPQTGANESRLGTAFYWLGQQVHSPVDVKANQADVIDNQLDVLSKTFLALTVSCARCHDHKFDAVSTRDFYALYGILSSSRFTLAPLHNASRISELETELIRNRRQFTQWFAEELRRQAGQFNRFLTTASSESTPAAAPDEVSLAPLDGETARGWNLLLQDPAWAEAASELSPARPHQHLSSSPGTSEAQVEEPFSTWIPDGPAFTHAFTAAGDLVPNGDSFVLAEEAHLHSGRLANAFQGIIRSPTFTIEHPFIHLRAKGHGGRIRVVIENFTLIRSPIYGGLTKRVDAEQFEWVTFDVGMWKGRRAYLEAADVTAADPAGAGSPPDGWLALHAPHFSDSRDQPHSHLSSHSAAADLESAHRPELVKSALSDAAALLQGRPLEPDRVGRAARLVRLMQQHNLLSFTNPPAQKLLQDRRDLAQQIPQPAYVAAMTDGTGLDERIFIRGHPRQPGAVARRNFLEALPHLSIQPRGSGRLELARALVHPDNPFTARVWVNRVWHHLFGRGIVSSVDNFGWLGEKPTHPQLLDWLALRFQADGWSTKDLIRMLVLSSTYQMSSQPSDLAAEERHPNNLFWHRMPLRRLSAESIRDALLAISGRLDPQIGGLPVPVHLTPFMNGRGRPGQTGPVDGDGRRSIYQEVRRNFLPPMMLAFDAPIPFTTAGDRPVSNVPAQALTLLNAPFVHQQAERWAAELESASMDPTQKIERMFVQALARPPSPLESDHALAFLRRQQEHHEKLASINPSHAALSDLAHALFNLKEFIFLP